MRRHGSATLVESRPRSVHRKAARSMAWRIVLRPEGHYQALRLRAVSPATPHPLVVSTHQRGTNFRQHPIIAACAIELAAFVRSKPGLSSPQPFDPHSARHRATVQSNPFLAHRRGPSLRNLSGEIVRRDAALKNAMHYHVYRAIGQTAGCSTRAIGEGRSFMCHIPGSIPKRPSGVPFGSC
jgi:hypothetical protein